MAEKVGITLVVDGKTGVLTTAGTQVGKLGKQLDLTKKKAIAASGGFSQLASSLGPLLAAGAVVRFFQDAVSAASKLQETQAKFETVFRQNIAQAEEFAANMVENFNVSEQAAKDYLATIQDTLVPMGLSRQAAADLSNEVVQLAADLGSFNDVPTETVVRDLQSALVGNTETVKKYGVVLKASDIQQRALTDSGKTAVATLTNAEKVTAAYKIILEGTSDAQGDVARTQDSFANKTRRVSSRIEDLRAGIGEQLQPVIGDFLQSLSDAIPFLTRFGAIITGVVGTILTSAGLILSTIQRLTNTAGSIIATFLAQMRALFKGNVAEAGSLGIQLRKDLKVQLEGFVEDTQKSNDRLTSIAQKTADTILGIERKKIKESVTDKESETEEKVSLTKAEIAAGKKLLDQKLQAERSRLQLDLAEKNLAREQRLELLVAEQEAEEALVLEAAERGIIQEEELETRRADITSKGALTRRKINQEGIEDVVKANEAFASRISNINARIADVGRKTFNALGDAIGKSFAQSVTDSKDFKESFTKLWKDIKTQVIAQITSIIVKLIALKAAQLALGGITGVFFGKGGRVPGPVKFAAKGLRTNGPTNLIAGEVPGEEETVVPDGQARGFAMGVLARKAGGGGVSATPRGGGGDGGSITIQGDVILQVPSADFTTPENAVKVFKAGLELLRGENPTMNQFSRASGDANEANEDASS